MPTKPFLKQYKDPDQYLIDAKEAGLKCKFIGILERECRNRIWVVEFFEDERLTKDELKSIFMKELGLTQKQSALFMDTDLAPADF